MTLNADGSVDIVVETYNVPRFSTIKLTITNEVDGIIEHTASVATAPDSNGKATTIINATIPHGFSRFTTEATWSAPAS
jgi:hypothetical protein